METYRGKGTSRKLTRIWRDGATIGKSLLNVRDLTITFIYTVMLINTNN